MANQTQSLSQKSRSEERRSRVRSDREKAERHLAELRTHHPMRPVEERVLSIPRLRQAGRWLTCHLEWASIGGERLRRGLESPSHRIGWWIAHLRLLRRPTLGRRTVFMAILAVLVASLTYFVLPDVFSASVSDTVKGMFLGATVLGAIGAAWSDVFRLPYYAWRVRHRILESEWCVLPTTAGATRGKLMGREEAPPIVGRRELYDELLPGILDRTGRDIQMIVGDPGSGKTTALVGVSKLLAQIGIVPVVVSLGNEVPQDLVGLAKKRFNAHARSLLGTDARLEEAWSWLREHRRLVVLADDIDRIAPDGERGFMVRAGLNELAAEGMPAVVTARPSGIPAGLAVSAIELQHLDEEDAVENVLQAARKEHGATNRGRVSPKTRANVARWIREGKFAEVPFYLELLARLVAADRCEELAPARTLLSEGNAAAGHRVRLKADGRCEWNPLWVRFQLLERFYDEVREGRVRRWLGIENRERERCLHALSEAALATLVASSLGALPKYKRCQRGDSRLRVEIEEFLDPDDRSQYDESKGERLTVSAHEVVETAERLYMLDREPDGTLVFKHRILQAYLAGRCLAGRLSQQRSKADRQGRPWHRRKRFDWLGALLSPCHPDRLTARMALAFAALSDTAAPQRLNQHSDAIGIERLLERLVDEAGERVASPQSEDAKKLEVKKRERRLDPRKSFDQEGYRVDPDDALSILTTAAEIASATGHLEGVPEILSGVRRAVGATRWTKVNAIPAIAALSTGRQPDGQENPQLTAQWARIWEFARDPDEIVRQAASAAMADDAYSAYRALRPGIDELLVRAALKSARDLPVDVAHHDGGEKRAGPFLSAPPPSELRRYGIRSEKHEVDSLCALGWVLPAIVSGLREQPQSMIEHGFTEAHDRRDGDANGRAGTAAAYAETVNGARQTLERLVRLAFQRRFAELEASVARGFKSDAMRHVDDPGQARPGFVDSNRKLVSDFCIDNAHNWYAKMVLHQTLALYTIAGSRPQVALDTFGRLLHRGSESHPFARQAAGQARRAVARHTIGSRRWDAFIWRDEGDAVGRRQATMNPAASQLVADVTLLLNLRQNAPEDQRAQTSRTSQLPYCLSRSRDRLEILGAGCHKECGCGLCPLVEVPVDEPDGKRTISRAFCRGQQRVARHHKPPWQQRIRKKALKEFWSEMEQRART